MDNDPTESMTDQNREQTIQNDTAVNVAGLLKAATGATRAYHLLLDRFSLDPELVAQDLQGRLRLTRLRDTVIATVEMEGTVSFECVRCLQDYDQPFEVEFAEEYHQTVDVRSGIDLLPSGDEDDHTSWIDDNHELDFGEVLRQEILLALPMRPDCGAACPGPGTLASDRTTAAPTGSEPIDERLAALAALLGDEPDDKGTGADSR